jgi:hypothetical protein
MAYNTDWLPASRTDQLTMCLNWTVILTADVRTAWGIPQTQYNELLALYDAAKALLQQAQSNNRTPVITERCRAAFSALDAKMRFFKSRYFLEPPLIDADIINLGLKPHDTHPTPSGPPTAEVTVEPFLAARHQLGVRIIYVSGNPNDKANKGYRIWYKVVAPGEAPPVDPEQLDKSFYTRRLKEVIQFAYGDSGKTVYIAVQVENDGKKGPWGPMTSAVIP